MRRGRPTAPVQAPTAAKPSPSPMRGTASDPFAALDSNNVEVRRAAADELAARFPSLDEFSLLHDRGQKFEFGQPPTNSDSQLGTRVTQALADEAFAFPPATKVEAAPPAKAPSAVPSAGISRATSVKKPQKYEPAKVTPRTSNPTIHQPVPQRSTMVSTGVQTSPSASPAPAQSPQKFPEVNKRPIWRVPDTNHHNRTLSQPRKFEPSQPSPSSLRPDHTLPPRPSLLDSSRSRSQTSTLTIPKSPASSRPSLESQRPSPLDLGNALDRSKSANAQRPVSIHVESNLEFLREREGAPGRSFDAPSLSRGPPSAALQDSDSEADDRNITSNVGFLRAMENEESSQKKHRRSSSQSKHAKRSSLSSITSNTKNIVKGKFGDAFRKFESNAPQDRVREPPLTPTDQLIDPRGKALTPIAGSEATGGPSDDERAIDETQDLPPEVRRELERRRLSQEERRVEAAAAEYRKRLADQGEHGKGKAGPSRASTIQTRVKNLLDESQKQSPVNKTAEGYGHFTDSGKALPKRPQDQTGLRERPAIARKPVALPQQPQPPSSELQYAKPRPNIAHPPTSSSAPPAAHRTATGPSSARPLPPPKKQALRTGGPSDFSAAKQTSVVGGTGREKPLPPVAGNAGAADEDWDVDSFSKRYPSLSGLEMVETEIPARARTVRDV